MLRILGYLTILTLALFGIGNLFSEPPVIAPSQPLTPAEELQKFRLPPGFVVELVAAEPDIHKPINLNFDDRGRLWVTESVEYPFAAAEGKARDAVKIIDLSDGVPSKKITTFAGGLNIPIGVLPLNVPAGADGKTTDGVIVHSIPAVHRLIDSNGEGKADKREVLFAAIGFNDTHGMTGNFTWGFDGWIYATHGFSNTSTIKGPDGATLKMQSGNTYRFRPDGTHLEQNTWGQVNPFGLAFDTLGNLYSADCHTKPIMQLLRGGYYDSFGKPHDGLGYAPEICGNYPDSTAVCGIAYYAADHFPPEYRDTAFIGDVVTNHIINYRFENHGATRKAIRRPDFLISSDPWFRPVDIKLGPDGALYVADFYNRIIGHYEVPLNHPGRDRERGRIWRIVYRGSKDDRKLAPITDLTRASVLQLVDELANPNLTVRIKAANQLVLRGKDAVGPVRNALRPQSSSFTRVHGLWVLERLGALDDETLLKAADDVDPTIRVHSMRIIADRHEPAAALLTVSRDGLRDSDGFVQMTAADSLGRHPGADNIRPLLELRSKVPSDDSHLLHTVRMALRNQLRPGENWAKLPQPWSEADSRAVADIAPGVQSPEAGAYLVRHLQKFAEAGDTQFRYVRHAARFAPPEQQRELVAFARANKPGDVRHQASLLRAIQQGTQERGGKLNDDAQGWAADMTGKLLAAKENDLLQLGVDLSGALKLTNAQGPLVDLAKRKNLPEKLRASAMSSLASIAPQEQTAFLAGVMNDSAEAMPLREQSIRVLAQINQNESRAALVKSLATMPARLQTVIATELAGSKAGAEALLDAITAGKGSARLLQDRPVELRLAQHKFPDLKERLAKLTAGLPPAEQRLQDLQKQRATGFSKAKTDSALGMKIFEKNCANCHQIANQGAKVGPQLDGIGIRGIDRLLEDIIDPNRNVDAAFRASTLLLKNGQLVQGLVLREEGEVVVVADQQGKEVRVDKKNIEEKTVTQLSPMPANLVDQIPESDFYHLLAFLLSQKTPPAK